LFLVGCSGGERVPLVPSATYATERHDVYEHGGPVGSHSHAQACPVRTRIRPTSAVHPVSNRVLRIMASLKNQCGNTKM
jgi:hypothetical protein